MVDSRDPKRIFAGASPIDVYRSEDGGENWRKLATPVIGTHCKGPFASRVMRFAQNPKKPDEIYAALEINGVMRSTDGGETWKDCSDGLIALSERPHLKSKIVSDTTAEGMLDGHAVTINAGRPRFAGRGAAHGPVPHPRRRQELAGHGGRPLLADHLRPRHQGLADRAQHALRGALASPPRATTAASIAARTAARAGSASTRSRCTARSCRSACTTAIPNQVYIGARYDGEVFGTQDGGKTLAGDAAAGRGAAHLLGGLRLSLAAHRSAKKTSSGPERSEGPFT